jgi:hypothetical protein
MLRHVGLVVLALALILVFITPGSHGAPIMYFANLDGPSESPPQPSPATGSAEVDYDPAVHTLHVHVSFNGLLGPTTASHIHTPTPAPFSGTAGVATVMPAFPLFPLGVTSGVYDGTLDLTQASAYNPAFVTANGGSVANSEAALALGLATGRAYFNIHTTFAGGGEIRGFLAVPEPTSVVMLGSGVLGILAYGWRTKGRLRK